MIFDKHVIEPFPHNSRYTFGVAHSATPPSAHVNVDLFECAPRQSYYSKKRVRDNRPSSDPANMENLNIRDGPPPLGAGQMPPPVPQLPPQMFTTAAQLLDLTDSEDYTT